MSKKKKWLYKKRLVERFNYITKEFNYIECNNMNLFRKMKTFAEIKANCLIDQEYPEIKARAKRKRVNLPTSWWDITASAWYERNCWKRNSKKRKQWE